jgi:hypothetical protein
VLKRGRQRQRYRGEKAYKAIAEEQRAFQSLCEAAYTVNGLQRVQRTVSRGLCNNAKSLSYTGLRSR